MIQLLCDEAYAFDYLSILAVKSRNDDCNFDKIKTFGECRDHLEQQIGKEKMDQVLNSNEYLELFSKNHKVFNLIDKLRANQPISAVAIDDANMERFFAKVRLQHKFFSDVEAMRETKVNYRG